ncbi:MAG: UbiA family prenyltransferase [Candidatus Moranbacteria bacterium]|nr:UbiA family prenyltransferase [Candidatus Moranbacteria bacterium]
MDTFKKIAGKLERIVDGALAGRVGASALFLVFSGIIAIRVLEEKFLAYSPAASGEIIVEYLHNFLFFANTFILIWLVLSWFLRKNPVVIAPVVSWAFFLILFPPLIDMAKTGGDIFWSFYLLNDPPGLWRQFITVFGDLPSGIVYFGSKIVFLVAVVFSFLLVWLKTRRFSKAFFSALAVYAALFFMGSFPSWATFAYQFFHGRDVMAVSGIQVAQFFGSPRPIFGLEANTLKYAFAYHLDMVFYLFFLGLLAFLFFWASRTKFLAVIGNARLPQLIYHSGLFVVGLGLGFLAYPQNMHFNFFAFLAVPVLLASVWLAWLASVVVNDLYDSRVDAVSNPERPLQKKIFTPDEYKEAGIIFFALSLLGGLVIGVKFAIILLIYQIIACFYSAEPYRLKRFLGVATFFSAIASLLVVFLGFVLFSGADNLRVFPWRVGFLLLIALTISLPIKDLKDIAGDKKDDVWTVPVLWGENIGRIIIAAGVFASFVLSVFFLNEFKLFWWSVLLGSAAFLATVSQKIKPRQVFWWVLGIVGIYGLIVAKIVFVG